MSNFKEYKVFAANPIINMYGSTIFYDNPGYYGWYFGTRDLVFPLYYAGITPFRIMCKAVMNPKEFPTISKDGWGDTLIRGPVLIFGANSKGWQRSLTEEEIKFLENNSGLVERTVGDNVHLIGYGIQGFDTKPSVKVWREEE